MVPCVLLLTTPWTRRAGKAAIRGLSTAPTPLILGANAIVRAYTNRHRRAASWILSSDVPRPYLTSPTTRWRDRLGTVLRDAATWRDLTWLLLNALAGLLLCVVSLTLFAASVWYLAVPVIDQIVPGIDLVPELLAKLLGTHQVSLVSLGMSLALFVSWWLLAPQLMRLYGHLARGLLGPTERAKLALRVQQLSQSRAETVDSQAAEIRRIERDLHDGAQARLVALGMNLGMAEELLGTNPDAARELLAEARLSSREALAEIRNLVRGIHPPVLADRGLEGAVRAFALDSPLAVAVDAKLPGRPPAPVESAAYFAVAETLTNAAKHGHASDAWVEMRYADGKLSIVVGDHGRGGAVVNPGGGLHGIRKRLAAFDGTLLLTSPRGGPTVIIMEVPCALSSGKISPSSGTA
ncbi:MAG: sensor histidine kinase [Streptosporangiales bacterium]|nr:sensor histidine kinase [Streptosporangiales bacterium]